MLTFYNIAIRFYYIAVFAASVFSKKASLWIKGRRQRAFIRTNGSIWFHFASLGEFEQGRPVLEKLRQIYPQNKFIITFFSPSGYEIRKNTPLADAVYYLPLDTAANARLFLDTINPKLAVFTKYEYWYHFYNELNRKKVPLFVISGIFRPGQIFFRWYGSLHRRMLGYVTHFFVQDDKSVRLLEGIGIRNASVSGDTRFDRVWANALQPRPIPAIKNFAAGQKIFIAGSTWPADEKLICALTTVYPDWKFIIAPHEVGEERTKEIIELLPPGTAISYSQLTAPVDTPDSHQTLVIDNIGMLSSLYQYGNIAYIGGGFGAGIHNTLEAAAFGLPVIFGPDYTRFNEAHELIALQAGFSINNADSLKRTVRKLTTDILFFTAAKAKAREYVKGHTGATETIIAHIKFQLSE